MKKTNNKMTTRSQNWFGFLKSLHDILREEAKITNMDALNEMLNILFLYLLS